MSNIYQSSICHGTCKVETFKTNSFDAGQLSEHNLFKSKAVVFVGFNGDTVKVIYNNGSAVDTLLSMFTPGKPAEINIYYDFNTVPMGPKTRNEVMDVIMNLVKYGNIDALAGHLGSCTKHTKEYTRDLIQTIHLNNEYMLLGMEAKKPEPEPEQEPETEQEPEPEEKPETDEKPDEKSEPEESDESDDDDEYYEGYSEGFEDGFESGFNKGFDKGFDKGAKMSNTPNNCCDPHMNDMTEQIFLAGIHTGYNMGLNGPGSYNIKSDEFHIDMHVDTDDLDVYSVEIEDTCDHCSNCDPGCNCEDTTNKSTDEQKPTDKPTGDDISDEMELMRKILNTIMGI